MEPDGARGSEKLDVWCVVPAYNCAATAAPVARQCRAYVRHVLVVDDGSDDADLAALLDGTDIAVLRHERNCGKGAALRSALQHVQERGGTHLVALDGDGQHLPDDLPGLIERIRENPAALVVGCRDFDTPHVPGSSRFGRAFSNLWVRLETGVALQDTQSGFRAYPVALMARLKLRSRHYDFEIEALTRAIWAGIPVVETPVSVVYPPASQRISHFRPWVDNARLSLLHARLVGRRLVPWPHRKLIVQSDDLPVAHLFRHPAQGLRALLRENATPAGLAASAAVGTLLAVLPLVGLHMIVILYATARLHLNKVMALSIQNLYAPPFVPFLCIQVGHYLRQGVWWTDFSREAVLNHIHHRALEWLLGSLVLAPLFAALAALAVFVAARALGPRRRAEKERG